MSTAKKSDKTCLASLKLLGDYWTLRIVNSLQDGETRFCELQRSLDNLNPVTLTNRLKKLEDARLIRRHEQAEGVSVSYSLTAHGNDALPVIRAINIFASKR